VRVAGYEQAARYGELIYRLLGEDIDFVPPGIQLESDRVEYSYLKGETRWSRDAFSAAVVAQFSFVIIQNPAASTHLITIEYINAISATLLIAPQNLLSAPGTPLVTIVMDTRQPAQSSSALVFAGSGAAAVINPGLVLLNTDPPYEGGIILKPGTQALLQGNVVNTATEVSMVWRERFARPEELAL